MRCCKRFSNLCIPILYRTFIQHTRCGLPGFIRGILADSSLTKLVTSVEFTDLLQDLEYGLDEICPTGDFDARKLDEAQQISKWVSKNVWKRVYPNAVTYPAETPLSWDGLVLFSLSMLPRVEKLGIALRGTRPDSNKQSAFDLFEGIRAYGTVSNLHTISLSYQNRFVIPPDPFMDVNYGLEPILSLLSACANLQTFNGDMIRGSLPLSSCKLNKLTSLRLDRSNLRSDQVQSLLCGLSLLGEVRV